MSIAYTRADRLDQLVTTANSAHRLLENHYTSDTPYWRAQSNFFIGRA